MATRGPETPLRSREQRKSGQKLLRDAYQARIEFIGADIDAATNFLMACGYALESGRPVDAARLVERVQVAYNTNTRIAFRGEACQGAQAPMC